MDRLAAGASENGSKTWKKTAGESENEKKHGTTGCNSGTSPVLVGESTVSMGHVQ